MLSQALVRQLSTCSSHRMLAEVMFPFLTPLLSPHAIHIFSAPCHHHLPKTLFSTGQPLSVTHYPQTFWLWAAQFDCADNLIALMTNTCNWDYQQDIPAEGYVLVLDDYHDRRTYLVLEGVCQQHATQLLSTGELDCLLWFAARWQCIRAETDAAQECKLRDSREAEYRDELKQREVFIDNMKLVHQLALTLSIPESLDELHRAAVEAVRDTLGFDRAALFLMDAKKRCFNGTYGTNERGETISEHHAQFDLHQLEPRYIEAIADGMSSLVIIENTPLYTSGEVIGQGWNGMLLLRDGEAVFGWIAMDNYFHRQPINDYQRQVLGSFASLLAQIYIRKRQEQNIRMLHASMVELSRCLTVSDVCKTAVAFAIKRMGIDRMAVFLTDESCSYLQGTWGTDVQGNIVNESYFRSATIDNDIVLLSKASPNEVVFKESVPIYHNNQVVGYGWTAMTMLTDSEQPIAFICVDNLIRRSTLTAQLREIIRMFASNLAEVLIRAKAQQAINEMNENLEKEIYSRTRELQKANQKLDIMAKMDPLTRLGNRRMLTHLLEQTCEQHSTTVIDYGVILIDIDHFGLFNNYYGHLEGDIALMRIGKILSQHTQSQAEQFCRIGGEEFVLLLAKHDSQQVEKLAEMIRRAVEQESIPHHTSPVSPFLTVSVGYSVARFSPSDIQFERMYSEADRALYQAKHQGRNCIVGASLNIADRCQ